MVFVLALDWAALHDILKGEPDVRLEWAFVIASVALFAAYAFRRSTQARKN